MDVCLTITVLLLVGAIAAILYSMLHYAFDRVAIRASDDRLADGLSAGGPLESLLNGSGINNIPRLNLVTTNEEVARANKCGHGPVYVSSIDAELDDAACVVVCLNASAHAIAVSEDAVVMHDNGRLRPGNYCSIGPRPECNTRNSVVLMTVNSVVCRSKFPNVVGGPLATEPIACNDRLISDPQNYLWDYRNNERYDPHFTLMTDENELLADGSYRFRCKYNGVDERGNRYIENPFARFHPIKNYCASLVYRAHPDVRTVFTDDGRDFYCDCGDPEETRVSNSIDGDRRSPCSHLRSHIRNDYLQRKLMFMTYRCFTLFSTLDDVATRFPCPQDQFLRQGSQEASVLIPFSENSDLVIEHPQFRDLPNRGRIHVNAGYTFFA